jgi:hypothetical protein
VPVGCKSSCPQTDKAYPQFFTAVSGPGVVVKQDADTGIRTVVSRRKTVIGRIQLPSVNRLTVFKLLATERQYADAKGSVKVALPKQNFRSRLRRLMQRNQGQQCHGNNQRLNEAKAPRFRRGITALNVSSRQDRGGGNNCGSIEVPVR